MQKTFTPNAIANCFPECAAAHTRNTKRGNQASLGKILVFQNCFVCAVERTVARIEGPKSTIQQWKIEQTNYRRLWWWINVKMSETVGWICQCYFNQKRVSNISGKYGYLRTNNEKLSDFEPKKCRKIWKPYNRKKIILIICGSCLLTN